MALFSELRADVMGQSGQLQTTPQFSLAKAVITPAVITMFADGSENPLERDQIFNMCLYSPVFMAVGAEGTIQMIRDVSDAISQTDIETLVEDCKAVLSPAMRETAMSFAVRVAFADGKITAEEKTALLTLGRKLEVSNEVIGKVVDVMLIMQRSPEVPHAT